jgi:hypothetical protein
MLIYEKLSDTYRIPHKDKNVIRTDTNGSTRKNNFHQPTTIEFIAQNRPSIKNIIANAIT